MMDHRPVLGILISRTVSALYILLNRGACHGACRVVLHPGSLPCVFCLAGFDVCECC